jgi:uncharacterized protein (TIGR01777 family)
MRSVCIAGASGFIGRNLVQRLLIEGYSVSFISREDFQSDNVSVKIKNCSIVVNLIGDSIAGLWTKRKRKRIYDSRILTTKKLVEAINRVGNEVRLLIQVSGVGIYDHRNIHTDESEKYDEGFLSMVIKDWEGELTNIMNFNLRVVVLRLGIVLDKNGGILKQVMYPLTWGVGFGVKSEEYFPFVQLEDLMNVFLFCIETNKIIGVVNVAAPGLTKISQFFRDLCRVNNVRYIVWFRTGFIRLLMGESGSLLTSGQNVVPAKLQNEGFIFRYDNIEDALNRACN